ncbi:MAG: PEP/pyruvate-binding domain-containing protein [Chloroflexota bacterium]
MVGGKGANLRELTRAGIPVPPGFVVTANAYSELLGATGIRDTIASHLSILDVDDAPSLNAAAAEIKRLISEAPMPADIAAAISDAYQALGEGPVAVRSSATAEDLAEASFAGQQESYLNVEAADVVRVVQEVWASLFEPRAIFYRAKNGFDDMQVGIAVVVQKMVQSHCSGVMFTIHPVTNNRSQIVIEAVYGLGEAIVSGMVTPDSYVVDKTTGSMLDCEVVPQEQEMIRNPRARAPEERNLWQPIDWSRRAKQKLSDEEATELAALGSQVEEHFGCPQDIEWAYSGGVFYIVQARAVTTVNH